MATTANEEIRENFRASLRLIASSAQGIVNNTKLMGRSLRLLGNATVLVAMAWLFGCGGDAPAPRPECKFFADEIAKIEPCRDCKATNPQDAEYLDHLRAELTFCEVREQVTNELSRE